MNTDCEHIRAGGTYMPSFWKDEAPHAAVEHGAGATPDGAGRIVRSLGELFWQIDGIGNSGHGMQRYAWTMQEAWLRTWFAAQMLSRGFDVRVDHAGNQWAWIGSEPSPDNPGVSVGSHMDSVPDGGAFDGPLGVISAIVAYDAAVARGWHPECPLAIVHFHDEEGARFSIACFGSRVLTGALPRARALSCSDMEGISVKEAMGSFARSLAQVQREARHSRALGGMSEDLIRSAVAASQAPGPEEFGAQPGLLSSLGAHVELHVEQGSQQHADGIPVAVADAIWAHGRWRIDITGIANHAGSTPMLERDDAMVAFAQLVQAARQEAIRCNARATIGRVHVIPNGVNVIASHVNCWLDCRAADPNAVWQVVSGLASGFPLMAFQRESWTDRTEFSVPLRNELADGLAHTEILGTAAGHDAGILQNAGVPSGMLFVRNHTGASHTPDEFATLDDCAAGVQACVQAILRVTHAVAARHHAEGGR